MENNNNFVFKQIDPLSTHRQSYKELHNLLFKGASATEEWIDWYHNDIGKLETWSIGTRTWGVFDNEKLIGIWSVEPKTLTLKNQHIKVGRCFAVGIHPDYRRQNLFVLLSQFAIKEERRIKEFEYILGFPQQGRAVVGGHLKAGWEVVSDIDIYSRSNKLEYQYQSKLKLNFITNFKMLEPNLGFNEDDKYLNLRWIRHPDHQYLCYSYNSAFIVLKPYGNFCHIVNMSGDVDNVRTLLDGVIVLSKKHGWEEINVWCSETGKYKEVLSSTGFSKGALHGLPIQFIAVRINANTPLILDANNFQMGVEEGY
jgi:hypothetical protein